ncbi:MAG: T9SS type A sorting domain-containing protein, partial [candidate division Zixibacteria bacterium]|nr:T9SS type A sorting domain-containing protein [candidate division Zixibacteria bacterium]
TWQPEERVTFALEASSEPFLTLEGNTLYLFWIDTRDNPYYYALYFKKGEIDTSISAIQEDSTNPPDALSLSVNPHPLNSSATIRYCIEYPARVKLSIYNLAGQLVAALVDGSVEVGNHSVAWNASGFSSGIYFCRLIAGDESTVKRMVLLR